MARIADRWLKAWRAARPGVEALLACLLAILVIRLMPEPDFTLIAPGQVLHVEGADGLSRWSAGDVAGRQIRPQDLERPEATSWLIWEDVDLVLADAPPAIFLSGPFAANAYVNGSLIGSKGIPAATRADEVAGPIESVMAIPPRLIRDEGNWIALEVSSHRAGYRPHAVVQGFFVIPFSADARRPIRYYLPLVMAGSALIALILAIALRTRRTHQACGYWLVTALTGLVLAGAAEVSRALINYPYDWHQPRQALSLAGLCLFGLALLRFSQLRWPAGALTTRAALATTLAIGATLIAVLTGYDAKSAAAVTVFATSAALWVIWRGDLPARFMGLAIATIPAYAMLWPGDALDHGVYACALAMIAIPVIRQPGFFLPDAKTRRPRLALHMTGRSVYLDLGEISYLSAAGNYTEIHTRTGARFLDNRNLGQILVDLPVTEFARVHRSHVVRLDGATSLTSAEGSRYRLELAGGASIPVSRREVAGLRERLAGRKA